MYSENRPRGERIRLLVLFASSSLDIHLRPLYIYFGFTRIPILPNGSGGSRLRMPLVPVHVAPFRGIWPRGQNENPDVHIPFSLAILA